MTKTKFLLFIIFYIIALFYLAINVPIGPHEATVYYTDTKILYYLTHMAEGWFGNGLDFRFPFVLLGVINIPIFFIMSRLYFSNKEESYFATTIFALLPGIITSAILVNIAVLVITFVLAFIIFYEKKKIIWQAISMISLLLVHDASVIFFIALAIFSAFKRDTMLFSMSIMLSAISLLYFNGLDIGGSPSGKFLELFGLYIALFSPLVFIYFFYALYKIWLRERKDILWYISFTAFTLSIFLSLRQRVNMTDFAPYVIVAVILMIVTYQQTLNVRLPQFQMWYKRGFFMVLFSLIISSMIILFHKQFFYLLEDKSKHFAYSFYEPYWQVLELHEIEQNCYTVGSQKGQYQLKYYGIEECNDSTVPKIHR
ncbi:hypothetical protein KKC13_04830 [bacterium]|nr:hypothetical protein [bacterium]MBU1959330.1 hypothetical protein [bacterium]